MSPRPRSAPRATPTGGLRLRDRVIGLVFAVLGVALQRDFINALLHGGKFGLISTMLAPLLVCCGLLLLVRPDWYGSLNAGDGSGNDRAFLVVMGLGGLGLLVNAGLYVHATWFR